MKVCYFGTFDAHYPRNRTLMAALRAAGIEVQTCHVPLWSNTAEKVAAAGRWFRPGLWLRWLSAYAQLSWRFLRGPRPDLVIVGYSGHFDMLLAGPLARWRKTPLVFDAFLSLYDSLVTDRQVTPPGSWKAKLLRWLDRRACRWADLVLLDTAQHIEYFRRELGLAETRFARVVVGANEDVYYPRAAPPSDRVFRVLFYGKNIPLQGAPYILRAAKLLETEPDLRFTLVGVGVGRPAAPSLARELELKNVTFIDGLPPEELAEQIAAADVCLGIFGGTEKSLRVVPNKAYEALAMGKPLITGRSPAADEVLHDGVDCLLCDMADPEALARAILALRADPHQRQAIAEGGRRWFEEHASQETLGRLLRGELEQLLAARSGRAIHCDSPARKPGDLADRQSDDSCASPTNSGAATPP